LTCLSLTFDGGKIQADTVLIALILDPYVVILFNKASEASAKTLDIGLINYILSSPAAISELSKIVTVKELKRRKLTLKISPSISSSDGETYRKIVPKVARKPAKNFTPPPPPARPARVVVDTVTAFYEHHDAYPASHNAVIKTMTPAMRQRLRARRIRGGAAPGDLGQTLLVGSYFAVWYALNVVYNSKFFQVAAAPVGKIVFVTTVPNYAP
jgi:hypothetical protein